MNFRENQEIFKKFMNFQENSIASLPDINPGDLPYLNNLRLENNSLTSLPEGICNLPNSAYITVGNNQLCPEAEYNYDDYECIDSFGNQDCD